MIVQIILAYMISDQQIYDIPGYEEALQTEVEAIEAETIEELALKINVSPERLLETVEQFNHAVQPGEFLWNKKDNKKAINITPPKSNWAIQINQGPFVAYPIICCNVFTNGGLATDINGRVLSNDDVPIPGLYAAGETAGLYYGKYPGGTSVLRGLVYGKRSGEHVANSIPVKKEAYVK